MDNNVLQVIKSVLLSIILSLAFVLTFALVLTVFIVPTAYLKTINQIFKIICIFLGGVFFIKRGGGLVKGAIHGALASVCSTLIIFAIAGNFAFSALYLLELLICAVAGAITGVIAVNIKKG